VSTLLGTGDDALFGAPVLSTSGHDIANFRMDTGDLDGDERLDLVITGIARHADSAVSSMSILLGKGDGSFR
jgi:hypothetical protein